MGGKGTSGSGGGGKGTGGKGRAEAPLPQRRNCEFRLLRYVPDAVRNEYVHIGVILREEGAPAEVQFTRDWRRVRCLDPDADTGLLEGMETELRRRLREEPDGRLMKLLEESLSLNVQMTAPKAYLAESVPAGMEELMRMYVEPPKRERMPRLSGRAAIQASMRSEFEQAGVWDLLRKGICTRGRGIRCELTRDTGRTRPAMRAALIRRAGVGRFGCSMR